MFDWLRNIFRPTESTQLREAREALQIAEARLQTRVITESRLGGLDYTWGEQVDPMDRYRDGDNFFYPHGYPLDRQASPNGTRIQSQDDLFREQAAIRELCDGNHLAVGLRQTLIDFLVGEGVSYKPQALKGQDPELLKDALADVQDVIDDFIESNRWSELEQELVGRAIRDGEWFLRYFPDDEDGTLQVRVVEPEAVRQPDALKEDPSTLWGIRTDKDDCTLPETYFLQYNPNDEYEEVKAEEIQHVKCNVDRNIKRGLSDFYCTAEGLEGVRKLLRNMREGESLRAAIAGFWQYESASAASVADHVRGKENFNRTDPQTGTAKSYAKVEPGTFLHVPKGKSYVGPPASQALASQVGTVQALLRSLGVRWRMPEYMVSGDSSNANYASTLVSGAPFARAIKRGQKFFVSRFLETVWYAVQIAFEAGRIRCNCTYGEFCRMIDIQAEAPVPEVANELEQATVDQADMDRGVLSKQTRRARRGLDDEQESVNIAEDPVAPMAPPPGAAPPMAGGGPSFFPRVAQRNGTG